MKFKNFIKSSFIRTKEGVTRFSAAFICSVLLFLTASLDILLPTAMDTELG